MEVILREHVDHLGSRGEIVKVADGYARNYLLPRKLALLATDGNKRHVERERAKFDAREAEDRAAAQRVADRLSALDIIIARRVGETEALYGSVTSADIAEALAGKGFEIDRRKLQLDEAIKRLGEFDVPVKLFRDVTSIAEGARRRRRCERCTGAAGRARGRLGERRRQDCSGRRSGDRLRRPDNITARRPEKIAPAFFISATLFLSPLTWPNPLSPNARCRTTLKPSAQCSGPSCCTTTRSTSRPK